VAQVAQVVVGMVGQAMALEELQELPILEGEVGVLLVVEVLVQQAALAS
jgi:hypothetical protein